MREEEKSGARGKQRGPAGCGLRAILRSGKEPEEIRRLLRDATEREIARKPEGHHFAQDKKETGFFPGEEGRGMSQIGG